MKCLSRLKDIGERTVSHIPARIKNEFERVIFDSDNAIRCCYTYTFIVTDKLLKMSFSAQIDKQKYWRLKRLNRLTINDFKVKRA